MWFGYGIDLFAHPDLRGQIACWHSSVLNGLPLLTYFEESGDPVALMKGYPGIMSVMRCVLQDGMGFAWFMLNPGVFGFEPPRTFEGGLALWGFLRAAKAYIVEDRSFGLVGYGCRLETTEDEIRAFPKDGVKKRVRFVTERIDVEALTGEIACVVLNKKDGSLRLQLADSTGLVKTVQLAARGLRTGDYEITFNDATERRNIKDVLALALPFDRAATISIRRI